MKKRKMLLMTIVGMLVFAGLAQANGGETLVQEKLLTEPDSTMSESTESMESLNQQEVVIPAPEVVGIGSESGRNNPPAEQLPNRGTLVNGLVGKTIKNTSGEILGKLTDVFVDSRTDEIVYLVVKSTGFLGFGGEERVVPFHAVQINNRNGDMQLSMNVEKFKEAPLKQQNMADQEWGRVVHEYYGVSPYWDESWAPPNYEDRWVFPGYEEHRYKEKE